MLNLSHKNLDVYRIALTLLKDVYQATKGFPKDEQFLLVSQVRRASISVCSNIAEGASRISKKEKKRFYEIARSSAVEVDTHFEIAITLEFYKKGQLTTLEQNLVSVFRILSKMIGNIGEQPH